MFQGVRIPFGFATGDWVRLSFLSVGLVLSSTLGAAPRESIVDIPGEWIAQPASPEHQDQEETSISPEGSKRLAAAAPNVARQFGNGGSWSP